MQRVAFILKVKENMIEEYKKHHKEVWPEMLDALREAVYAHPADAGLPAAGYRAARYAEALAGTWARTTTEPPDGTA